MVDRFQKFNGDECHITASQPAKLYCVTDDNTWSKFQCGYGKLEPPFSARLANNGTVLPLTFFETETCAFKYADVPLLEWI